MICIYMFLLITGITISWSRDTVVVTEGEMISISLLLNREPGVQFNISIFSVNINTTGLYAMCNQLAFHLIL